MPESSGSTEQPPGALTFCSACGHQVSTQAASCPHCGHPLAAPSAEDKKWEEINRMGSLVAIVIATLTLGGQAVFLKLVKGDVSEASADTLLQVFLQTTPLTLAVMLVGVAVVRDWVDGFLQTILLSAVALLVSLHLGSWLGGLGQPPAMENSVLGVVFGATVFYWKIYGASLFISSLVLGAFLAWVANKLWPQPKSANRKTT